MKQKTYQQKLDSIVELIDMIRSDKLTTKEDMARIILSILGISEKDIKL